MEQRISIITLGVADVSRARTFWEIAWNPGFTLGPDGSLVLPDFG